MRAVYELLRVARRGVLLIEPNEMSLVNTAANVDASVPLWDADGLLPHEEPLEAGLPRAREGVGVQS